MELLVCERCYTIVDAYRRNDIVVPLPQNKYMRLGKSCAKCGHEVLVRRWSHEYVLKEQHEDDNG